jgi:hypothetical protein
MVLVLQAVLSGLPWTSFRQKIAPAGFPAKNCPSRGTASGQGN